MLWQVLYGVRGGPEQVWKKLSGALCLSAKRGLRDLATKEKADRARLWPGQERGRYAPSDGARDQSRGPDVGADD